MGDIVIADNLPTHKIEGVHAALTTVGASLWFLLLYCSDFNPIEWCFPLPAADRDTLWPLPGTCHSYFTEVECREHLRHCGYTVTTAS